MGQIAEGDLRADIHITSNDEIGQLLTAMKKLVQGFQGAVRQIATSTGQLSESTGSLGHMISMS